MLNEWSDREPPKPPRSPWLFWRRTEFWVAVYVVIAFAGLLLNAAQLLRSLF